MKAIYLKEINSFFSSIIGYVVIIIFLAITSYFFMFKSKFNIFESYDASLYLFFELAPRVFLFLVPAITMRSFAEEKRSKTLEILFTKPISDIKIVIGKYLASLTLVIFAILPTILYYLTIYYLSSPTGNVDVGATIGSYIGLLFLAGIYVAIGVFSSSLNGNQIIAFIIALIINFIFYFILGEFRELLFISPLDPLLEYLSFETHYISISRGLIDSRDIVYFITYIILFLLLTKLIIQKSRW
jgi:ABC-2 type transport system permease protein